MDEEKNSIYEKIAVSIFILLMVAALGFIGVFVWAFIEIIQWVTSTK